MKNIKIEKNEALVLFAAILYGAIKKTLSSFKEIKVEKRKKWYSGETPVPKTLIVGETERWELNSPDLDYVYVIGINGNIYRKKDGHEYEIKQTSRIYYYAQLFKLYPVYQDQILKQIE